MAELRDSLLRAIDHQQQLGTLASVVAQGMPWQCCTDAITDGPAACTCWEPIYDLPQSDPDLSAEPHIRPGGLCDDCAYRPGSPERTGDDRYISGKLLLDQLAKTVTAFYCHDGMRQPVAWRHPAGMRIPAEKCGDYQPPIVDAVPYQTDGTPGYLCAGWAANVRAHLNRSRRLM